MVISILGDYVQEGKPKNETRLAPQIAPLGKGS